MRKLLLLLCLSAPIFAQCGPAGQITTINGIRVCKPSPTPSFSTVTIGTTVHDASTSEPTCNSGNRGHIVRVQGGAGVADTYRQCVKDAADAYAWAAFGSGGGGPASLTACEVTWGSRASTATVIADDDDVPVVCVNLTGSTISLSAVSCTSWGGTASMLPIVTGGAANSILTGALTCGANGTFATGTLNGSPTLANTGTLDMNISLANSSTYIVMRIKRQ